MSKTYRKRIEKNWVEDCPKGGYLESWVESNISNNKNFKKQETAKHYTDNGWKGYHLDRGPHWFVREYMTVPSRREAKRCETKIKALLDYNDSPEFPLHRKPKEYWW